MHDNYYYNHLIYMLKAHQSKELEQIGKSDIEPIDYSDQIEKWYQQLFDFVNKENPPTDFVRSINVYQDDEQTIKKIEYIYCNDVNFTDYLSINIFTE